MAGQLDDKIAALQQQVDKLQSQKDHLLKELDEVEELFESKDRLYRRYFPVILDMVSQNDGAFSKACRQLGVALRKKATPAKMEYIFNQMKTAMIKEDIGDVAPKKKKGMFSSLLKSSSNTAIDDFKQSYHDVVNKLKSTLDKKYSKKLENLTSRLLNASDTHDINEVG